MAKKHETTKKTQDAAASITKAFEKILAQHGLENHKITKFSFAPANNAAITATDSSCPPGFHEVQICSTVNNVTTCKKVCVKTP